MNIYTIYMARNTINGKSYIGFDSKWPKRKYEHHYNSTTTTSNQVFYNAIRKHGWDNFEWSVLYQSQDADHTLSVMENYFIMQYNSYIHFENSTGYNMTLGGEGTIGYKHTMETRNNISKSLIGKTKGKSKPAKSIASRRKISISKKGNIPWNKGKTGLQTAWNKGKTGVYSTAQLETMSRNATGRSTGKQWFTDGVSEYFIHPDNNINDLPRGRLSKSRNMKTKTCPNCGIEGSGGNMTRYHFDNCKHEQGT